MNGAPPPQTPAEDSDEPVWKDPIVRFAFDQVIGNRIKEHVYRWGCILVPIGLIWLVGGLIITFSSARTRHHFLVELALSTAWAVGIVFIGRRISSRVRGWPLSTVATWAAVLVIAWAIINAWGFHRDQEREDARVPPVLEFTAHLGMYTSGEPEKWTGFCRAATNEVVWQVTLPDPWNGEARPGRDGPVIAQFNNSSYDRWAFVEVGYPAAGEIIGGTFVWPTDLADECVIAELLYDYWFSFEEMDECHQGAGVANAGIGAFGSEHPVTFCDGDIL